MRYVTVIAVLYLVVPFVYGQEEEAGKEDGDLKGTVDGLSESFGEYRNYVDILRRIKVSGYVQTQYRLAELEGTAAPFSGGNMPRNVKGQFELRRGRLKVQYEDALARFVFQLEGRQSGVTVKDAYGAFTEPWLRSFGVQAGIFDRPFGYEVSYSSGSRESPERSRVVQTLLPGERELGAKVFYAPQYGAMDFLRVDLGIVNGSGPLSAEFDNFKDVLGRAGVQLPFGDGGAEVDLGISGYLGNVRSNTRYVWSMGTVSPGIDGFVVDSSLSNIDHGIPRRYLGFDTQLYYEVPALGGAVVRGEVITGTQPGGSSAAEPPDALGTSHTTVSPSTQPSGPIYKRNFLGWYLYLVQNLGENNQIVAKFDSYDPNTDVAGSGFTLSGNLTPADLRFSTFGLGLVHHWNEYVKFVAYYEWVSNETVGPAAAPNSTLAPYTEDLKDNVLTLRMQIRF
jgi:hypothetical protein